MTVSWTLAPHWRGQNGLEGRRRSVVLFLLTDVVAPDGPLAGRARGRRGGSVIMSDVSAVATTQNAPRRFDSSWEAARDLVAVARRVRPLAAVYAGGRLDGALRERVMVAVSRVNACSGCTLVHTRWALRVGVTPEELDAVGLEDLGRLDRRSRAAVVYAVALAETRFRSPPPDVVAAVAAELTPAEVEAVEAVSRMMALANLTASTAEALVGRLSPGR